MYIVGNVDSGSNCLQTTCAQSSSRWLTGPACSIASSIKSSSWNKRAGGWREEDDRYYQILMPWLPRIIFFWAGSRRWNVNKSIRARSRGLRLPLLTIKRLFMLPWRAIPVTLAHWREPQIIISPLLSLPLSLSLDSGLSFYPPSSIFFLPLLFFHSHRSPPFFCSLFPFQPSLLLAPIFSS